MKRYSKKVTEDAILMNSITELVRCTRQFARRSYEITSGGTPTGDMETSAVIEAAQTLKSYCEQVLLRADFCENDKVVLYH